MGSVPLLITDALHTRNGIWWDDFDGEAEKLSFDMLMYAASAMELPLDVGAALPYSCLISYLCGSPRSALGDSRLLELARGVEVGQFGRCPRRSGGVCGTSLVSRSELQVPRPRACAPIATALCQAGEGRPRILLAMALRSRGYVNDVIFPSRPLKKTSHLVF